MSFQSTTTLKKQLRQQTRLLRQELSAEQLVLADRQLSDQYQQHLGKKNFQKIAIYLQHDSELGTAHLIDYLFQTGCQLYLPKIHSDGSNLLEFARYHQNCRMADNRFGIPEPVSDEIIAVEELELILLPLTAFDLRGNRLGMGGGFYDRTLADLVDKKPLLVGLAYDFQQVADCPVEAFDQPLQMILSPTRAINFAIK